MKIGNVSGTVLKRSILKQLHTRREEAIFTPSVEEMCAGIRTRQGEQVIFSSASVYGNAKDIGVFAMAKAVNETASRGAEPIGVSVQIDLPPYAYESRLKAMAEAMEAAGSEHGLQILCAKAEVSPVLSEAMVSVTAVGTVEDRLLESGGASAGQDIVLSGWTGLEGMLRIARAREEELARRFVPSFMNQIWRCGDGLFALDAVRTARAHGASALHQIGQGGILAALWELAEAADAGLEADMRKMSICQETVEVCEHFRINPYQLTSAGSMLIATDDGAGLAAKLTAGGKQASVIGRLTDGRERVLLGGEEKRFLDRPQPDELLKLYGEA